MNKMCTTIAVSMVTVFILMATPLSAHPYHHFKAARIPVPILKLPNIVYTGPTVISNAQLPLIPAKIPAIPQIPAIPTRQQIVRPMTGEFWQTQNMVQRVPAAASRCRTSRGCASGEDCVFAEQWQCPDWIPNLNCQCRQGCRHQNTFIPFGKTVVVDKCGNKCSCFSVYGTPECSYESC